MKPIALSLLLLVTIFFVQCKSKEPSQEKNISLFKWLNGSWTMAEKDGVVTEEWKLINDSLMEGRSDFIKRDTIIPFETIKLYKKDTSFYYEAKAAGQNNELPVGFRITSISDTSFVAENPEHDFPKRITYQLITKDSFHAFIDGGPSMSEKKSDFYYSRIKK